MNAIDVINNSLEMANTIVTSYLEDLSEEELMHRPHPKCNHLKWQLGHLISSDNQIVNGVVPGALPPLPDGFAEKYSKEQAVSDNPDDFHGKSELMQLYADQFSAIRSALEKLSETELDQPSPEAMQNYAPTVGAAFNLVGHHWIMHSGQWAVIRRQLGRPPLF